MSSQVCPVIKEEPLPRSSSTHPSMLILRLGHTPSMSGCQRRFLGVASQGLWRRRHSCQDTALVSGISGINDLVSVVLGEGRDITQMFPADICGASAFCMCLIGVTSPPPTWAGMHLPNICIHQTLSPVPAGPLHFFFQNTTAVLLCPVLFRGKNLSTEEAALGTFCFFHPLSFTAHL